VKRLLTQHIGLKLLSLVLASALWFLYSGSRELTTAITVPVQYRNIPTDSEIGSDLVGEVRLILRGPSPLLSRVASSPPPVILDLSRLRRSGVTTFSIHRSNVSLPAGVVLERAIPSQIQVQAEARVVKDVRVVPVFDNLPEGMEVGSWAVDPPRLTLSGPKSRLDALQEVRTDPIDLRLHADDRRVATVAFAGDPHAHFATPPQVTVKFELRRAASAAPKPPMGTKR